MLELAFIGIGIATGMALARALLKQHSLVANTEPEADGPEVLEFTVPEWVQDVEVEAIEGRVDRFVVLVDGVEAGFIDRRGKNWDAFLRVDETRSRQLEIGTTRKRAITAVYAAFIVLRDVIETVVPGKAQPYSPRQFEWTKPEKHGEAPEKVERFFRAKHSVLRSEHEIASATGIPSSEVAKYAKKLAEMGLIYGIISKQRIATFKRIEERPSVEGRRRRVVATVDITKMRKSPALTAKQKRELPKVRHERVHSFALSGPKGEIGFYEAD